MRLRLQCSSVAPDYSQIRPRRPVQVGFFATCHVLVFDGTKVGQFKRHPFRVSEGRIQMSITMNRKRTKQVAQANNFEMIGVG
jgi:hypothetical protein